MGHLKPVLIAILIALVVVASAACGIGSSKNSPQATPLAAKASDVIKPKPLVLGINAATTGVFDQYYAIVDATIRNDGADGMVIVVGSITQGGENKKSELPLYISNNSTQTVRLIFPLKWKGGDWTPTVQTEIP